MDATGRVTAWPNLMVELPATVGAPGPPVKGELRRELTMFWLAETLCEASPRMILHSLSGVRSIVGVSTGLRGKLGTRCRMLEINAAPRSPGTLAPSVMTVETRLLTDLRKFSSASAILDDLVLDPPLSHEVIGHRVMVLSEVMVRLGPHVGHLGTDPLFDLPHVG